MKPANLIIQPDGRPVLIDFGLACCLRDANVPSCRRNIVGSPSYMAPELFTSGSSAVGPQTDIYSLGAVLHELLTGRPLVEGQLGRLLEHAFGPGIPSVPLGELPLPYGLCNICRRMLAHCPRRRFDNMREVVTKLDRWMAANLPRRRLAEVRHCISRC